MLLEPIEKLLILEGENIKKAVIVFGDGANKATAILTSGGYLVDGGKVIDSLYKFIVEKKSFKTASFYSENKTYVFTVSKKGKLLFNSYKSELLKPKEKYLVPPTSKILEAIGISADGAVKNAMFDKFKQINKFAEIALSVCRELPINTIIDFGCGKSYLGFALSEYFQKNNIPTKVIGVDLKKDVIANCEALAKKLALNNMSFFCGDIFTSSLKGDLVICLHACDTATDFALFNAYKMDAKAILAVPCCQHELNTNASFQSQLAFSQFGLLKERYCALATDAIRAELLTYLGYKTKVVEFIDFAFSPKNIMLKCEQGFVSNETKAAALSNAEELLRTVGCQQTLYNLLFPSDCA